MLNSNITEIKVSRLDGWVPDKHEIVEVRYEGPEFVTLKWMENQVLTHVQRIDATHYINLSTKEQKEYKTMDENAKKAAKRSALGRTMDELRALLRCNFGLSADRGHHRELFITLTYRENMQSEKQLYSDCKNFIDRLQAAYPQYLPFTYIAVMEPQGRGAWHVHLMLKSAQNGLYIAKERLTEIWGHGMTSVAELKSDDIGAYYTVYFTGLICEAKENDADRLERAIKGEKPLSGETILQYEQAARLMDKINGVEMSVKKSIVKSGRLDLYPKGFHFYRCSRNVQRPTSDFAQLQSYSDSKAYKKRFEKASIIQKISADGEVTDLNRVYSATYKKKFEKGGEKE